jgi:hypothetical protein
MSQGGTIIQRAFDDEDNFCAKIGKLDIIKAESEVGKKVVGPCVMPIIKFIPLPQQGHHVQLWYYPQAKTLTPVVTDPTIETDRLVSILPIFNDYVILDTCIQILQKEESDVSSYVREKQETVERIRMSMGTRDTQPDSVTDIYNVNGTYGNIGIVR